MCGGVLELNGAQPNQSNGRAGNPRYAMARGDISDDNGTYFKIHPR